MMVIHTKRPDFAASYLIAPGYDHKFVVHALAVDDLAHNYFPFGVDFFQDLRIVVLKDSTGCVEVLLVGKDLINILIFKVSYR